MFPYKKGSVMSFVSKIEKKSKVIAMSEKLESDLNKMAQHIIDFKNTLHEINQSEEEIHEIKTVLKNNHNYQKAAAELFDFLRMTTHNYQTPRNL
jgi:septal ring factor EnvC (AmiA/AmiB activator)